MHEDDLRPAQKRPCKKSLQHINRKRRRRAEQPSTVQSATTTDASLMASDLDHSSNVSFEPASFDDEHHDHDDDDDDNHPIKPERGTEPSEVDILEDIHFLNQSIDNLKDHLQMAELSASAMKMIREATKRLVKIEQMINGSGGSTSGAGGREQPATDDWMTTAATSTADANDKYDIGVNLCQTDANRLMQSGHIFFNGGKLCFSTRKKSS